MISRAGRATWQSGGLRLFGDDSKENLMPNPGERLLNVSLCLRELPVSTTGEAYSQGLKTPKGGVGYLAQW